MPTLGGAALHVKEQCPQFNVRKVTGVRNTINTVIAIKR